MEKQLTCAERIDKEWAERRSDFERMFAVMSGEREPDDETTEDSLYEYGLSFDYVTPGTFEDQKEGYWRYQLSWGGPSDELRIFKSRPEDAPYRVEYRFMDWFDGASLDVTEDVIVAQIVDWFDGADSFTSAFEQARE